MGYINSERPPEKWNQSWFKLFVERVRSAVNYLNEGNFPNGLSGQVIQNGSLYPTALTFLEIPITIIANTDAHPVEDIVLTPYGGYVYCSPSWSSNGGVGMLEISGGTVTGATATYELHASGGLLARVESTYNGVECKRSAPFALPQSQECLILKVKTTDAAKPAWLTTARLIIQF